MSFLINPYAFLAAGGDFESIATVTVGSGGASSIEFTSIPGTYQHLQVRYLARSNRAVNALDGVAIQLNGNTGATSYAYHELYGNSLAGSTGVSSTNWMIPVYVTAAGAVSSAFGAGVVDILDYSSSSKNTTIRVVGGTDNNGGNSQVSVGSGLFINTAAVTSIKMFAAFGSSFVQYSTAALYGIKAP